jgi:hypothetical protein
MVSTTESKMNIGNRIAKQIALIRIQRDPAVRIGLVLGLCLNDDSVTELLAIIPRKLFAPDIHRPHCNERVLLKRELQLDASA